jgi:hypothetical protein
LKLSLFGFEILRTSGDNKDVQTFVHPTPVDDIGNANVVGPNNFGNFYSNNSATAVDITENSHIQQCRDIAAYHEVDNAIEDIVSEAILVDENEDSIKLDLSKTSFSEPVKQKIRKSFKKIYNILDFKTNGHSIFRKWYVDGRIYYHIVIDENNIKDGIQELRNIDPKKMRRIRTFVSEMGASSSANNLVGQLHEYYAYNPNGIDEKNTIDPNAIKIAKDSIAFAHSGLLDPNNKYIVSFLHKAIANANKLRTLENSMVIYRLVRAPERRIFYIDVGNLPKARAEQYMYSVMQKYKTKITYDSVTGKIRDDRSIMSMTEDIYIPRRDASKSTEITTLEGLGKGSNGTVDELDWFKKQLKESLNVPASRSENTQFNMGQADGMSREEAKFAKFINRLRTRFNALFDDLLGKELVLTRVMSIEEWEYEKRNIHYDYLKDNYFVELLESDMFATRLGTLAQAEPYIGKYISMEYARKNILKMTDEEIAEEKRRIEAERKEHGEDVHTPAELQHQATLHQITTDIDMEKELAVNDALEANPFAVKEDVDSTIEENLSVAMTDLFRSMAESNKLIAIDDIDE